MIIRPINDFDLHIKCPHCGYEHIVEETIDLYSDTQQKINCDDCREEFISKIKYKIQQKGFNYEQKNQRIKRKKQGIKKENQGDAENTKQGL